MSLTLPSMRSDGRHSERRDSAKLKQRLEAVGVMVSHDFCVGWTRTGPELDTMSHGKRKKASM